MFGLSNPNRFQKISDKIYPWITYASLILISLGLYFSFFQSPPDYLQGESVRIMYIHVPSAWLSMMIYSSMAVCSFISIVFRHTLADIIARSSALIGATFTLITLITGSIWGKPTWGTWWVWDARLTSFLILLFIYLGLIFLEKSFKYSNQGNNSFAYLAIIGGINIPIIKFSVDWWNTLHQGPSVMKFSSPSIANEMLYPLIYTAIGFTSYLLAAILLSSRNELLDREKNTKWIRSI